MERSGTARIRPSRCCSSDAGYHIGETYKVWSPGTPVDAPYGAGKYAYEKAGGRFNQFSENVTRMVAGGTPVEAAKQALYDEVKGNFQAFLADRRPDQPFCYWFGPTNVHRKWIKGSGKALWGIDPDALQGKMPPFLADVPEVREDLADYFGEAQALDAAIGVLLQELKATGELDNTLIVISGDHGAAGFGHGKCTLYDFGTSVSLAIRWGGAKGGRVVDDLVSLTDLAPTFLEVAGVAIPAAMTGRSLVNVLTADKPGQVDPARTQVFFGRERHVEDARAGYLPYPQRAIRTHDFAFIINFKPDRYPMGDPRRLDGDNPPTAEQITEDTRVTLADEDAGPAKAWLVTQRNNPRWRTLYERAYGKRPGFELYDLKADPDEVKNVADDPRYAQARADLESRLLKELRAHRRPAPDRRRQVLRNAPHGRSGERGNPSEGQGQGKSQGKTEGSVSWQRLVRATRNRKRGKPHAERKEWETSRGTENVGNLTRRRGE